MSANRGSRIASSLFMWALILLWAGAALCIHAPSAVLAQGGLVWPMRAVSLRGTLGDGVGTRAVLVQGPNRLLDVELRDETHTFEVDVPAAGQLLLAFVNDFYEPPEDRNLWVSVLEFTPRAP